MTEVEELARTLGCSVQPSMHWAHARRRPGSHHPGERDGEDIDDSRRSTSLGQGDSNHPRRIRRTYCDELGIQIERGTPSVLFFQRLYTSLLRAWQAPARFYPSIPNGLPPFDEVSIDAGRFALARHVIAVEQPKPIRSSYGHAVALRRREESEVAGRHHVQARWLRCPRLDREDFEPEGGACATGNATLTVRTWTRLTGRTALGWVGAPPYSIFASDHASDDDQPLPVPPASLRLCGFGNACQRGEECNGNDDEAVLDHAKGMGGVNPSCKARNLDRLRLDSTSAARCENSASLFGGSRSH